MCDLKTQIPPSLNMWLRWNSKIKKKCHWPGQAKNKIKAWLCECAWEREWLKVHRFSPLLSAFPIRKVTRLSDLFLHPLECGGVVVVAVVVGYCSGNKLWLPTSLHLSVIFLPTLSECEWVSVWIRMGWQLEKWVVINALISASHTLLSNLI